MSDRQGFHPAQDALGQPQHEGARHVEALDRGTCLPRVAESGPDDPTSGEVEVGIRHDHGRILASQLEGHGDQLLCRSAGHRDARGHASREADMVELRLEQGGSRRTVPRQQAKHSRGQGLLGEPVQALGEQGRPLRRLMDDRVPGGQGRGDRGHREQEGIVPRRDHSDHALGLVGQKGLGIAHDRVGDLDAAVPQEFGGVRGVVRQEFAGGKDFGEGVRQRFAVLAAQKPCDTPVIVAQLVA
ncbi:hypothetical protein D3C87_1179540 [compost metagenome]